MTLKRVVQPGDETYFPGAVEFTKDVVIFCMTQLFALENRRS
jgi:hypothetical protein